MNASEALTPKENSGAELVTAASSTRAQIIRKRMRVTPVYLSARFLPYDDVCKISFGRKNISKVGGVTSMWDTDIDTNEVVQNSTVNKSSSVVLNQSCLAIQPAFLRELESTLAQMNNENITRVVNTSIQVDNTITEGSIWHNMFKKWPLELAASGYAEWWLRHTKCDDDASPLFQILIEKIAGIVEERRRKLNDVGGRIDNIISPDVLHGALTMLKAIYALPPKSLRVVFETPLNHQKLFFIICRLGAHQNGNIDKGKNDVRKLAICLSLAAAVAKRIAGNQLPMRSDLLLFLGKIQREWIGLLEIKAEEKVLREEFKQVESLLPLALD